MPSTYANYGTRHFWGSLFSTPQKVIDLLWANRIENPDQLCRQAERHVRHILAPLGDQADIDYAIGRIKADLEFNGRQLAE